MPIKFEDREIIDATNSSEAYFEIDNRKFMLFEVGNVTEPDIYEVQDEAGQLPGQSDLAGKGLGSEQSATKPEMVMGSHSPFLLH